MYSSFYRHCLELSSSLHVITFFISGLPKDRSDAISRPQDLVGTLLLLFAKTADVTADRLAIEVMSVLFYHTKGLY